MEIPSSCTLSTRQAVQRVAEWRAFLASDVDLVEVADCRARLRLAPSSGDTLAKAADLAQREVACCSFFRFSIDVGHDELWLVVEVDDSSAASLDALVGLVPPRVRAAAGRQPAPLAGSLLPTPRATQTPAD